MPGRFSQGLGLGLGQVEQLHLDRVDLAGQIGRVEAFDSGGHGRELLCIKDARCLQALPWGGRLVIDALAATVDGAGVADGLFGRGEEVAPQRHQRP
ncbi:Uncharacterised protein [Mycobacterium tuberculosis]|nr:Uncharacterised protein [Mycobacterium tuberculosis]CMF56805.1 Uncharacterised protein [Mycobacterium tuberculosis]CMN01572.1 Uncharacterised protein [Mycobacterium tuberculosis]CMQ81696.1 Uncharacterised protein [Mycobacterium tuberculosis]